MTGIRGCGDSYVLLKRLEGISKEMQKANGILNADQRPHFAIPLQAWIGTAALTRN